MNDTNVTESSILGPQPCNVVVIWIDWYAYHVARFRGLLSNVELAGRVRGIELVGGIGVHQGLKFREELPADLPVETLMPNSSWQDAGQLRLAVKLWRRLSALSPDVVLIPGYYTLPAVAAALWSKAHGSKSVLMTESTADDHARVWWKEFLKAILINSLFDWAVAGGKAHFRYLDQLGFPLDRTGDSYDVVDNNFVASTVHSLRKEVEKFAGTPKRYFLYVGRLAPEKNIEGLLAGWTTYRNQGGSWPIVLVGAGPSEEALRAAASQSDYASDIHFAGHKGYLELIPFYAFGGCFVLPSTREPWGLVVNEAMAAGLPVIVSTRCGCVEDLVQSGENGFTFDPSSNTELARCLTQIESLKESQRVSMSLRSTEIISNYSPQLFGNAVSRIAVR